MARVDMEFHFGCLNRQLASERSERVRCRVKHENRYSISTSNHVLFCLLYTYNSPLQTRKADYIKTKNKGINNSRMKITQWVGAKAQDGKML